MKILLVKQMNGLIPAYDSDHDALKAYKIGEVITCEVKKPRNIKFHRKFFALLNLAYQNQDLYSNIADMRHDLTVQAGYYHQVVNVFTGEVRNVAKSIRFSKMDAIEFSQFYDSILEVICKWLGITKLEVSAHIAQFF